MSAITDPDAALMDAILPLGVYERNPSRRIRMVGERRSCFDVYGQRKPSHNVNFSAQG